MTRNTFLKLHRVGRLRAALSTKESERNSPLHPLCTDGTLASFKQDILKPMIHVYNLWLRKSRDAAGYVLQSPLQQVHD